MSIRVPSLALLLISCAPTTLATGCASGPAVTPLADKDYDYQLGAGDKLKVVVYGEDRLTGEFPVGTDGSVSFPLVGEVPAAGRTLDAFHADLVGRLAAKFLRDPSVTVEIENFRPVFILGEVTRPGEVPYAKGMTVNSLVAVAGGFTYRADRGRAMIRHEAEPAETSYRLTSDAAVRPGDTVRIGQRYF